MSGFVVGFGHVSRPDIDTMAAKIAHRGRFLSGTWSGGGVTLFQNYLRADTEGAAAEASVPVADPEDGAVRVCFDGEIGNAGRLADEHSVPEGAFLEERLILKLFRESGKGLLDALDDAVFTFAVSDGKRLLVARDLLGIKTLFYGRKDGTLYIASEMKSLAAVTEDIHEFPAGHYMDENGQLVRYADLPKEPPEAAVNDLEEILSSVREIIRRSVRSRISFERPTAALLSGGMDSSVISYLASELYRESAGDGAKLMTLAIGVGESGDIKNARTMAGHIGSDHRELIVDIGRIVDVLPEVIYHLESFDPSLVRSSVSNYLISEYAKEQGIEVLLSGEGGDEIFCGYTYLQDVPLDQLFSKQMECMRFLHNNASLRLDRMNQCHSIHVVAPLISGELLRYSMRIPPEHKQKPDGSRRIEKWIFRKAFEPYLPEVITWRLKAEFSQGSGSAGLMPSYFEERIGDAEFEQARSRHPFIRSKEELAYFRLFMENFGENPLAIDTVGQWIAL